MDHHTVWYTKNTGCTDAPAAWCQTERCGLTGLQALGICRHMGPHLALSIQYPSRGTVHANTCVQIGLAAVHVHRHLLLVPGHKFGKLQAARLVCVQQLEALLNLQLNRPASEVAQHRIASRLGSALPVD